jgi:hypothetical protein
MVENGAIRSLRKLSKIVIVVFFTLAITCFLLMVTQSPIYVDYNSVLAGLLAMLGGMVVMSYLILMLSRSASPLSTCSGPQKIR